MNEKKKTQKKNRETINFAVNKATYERFMEKLDVENLTKQEFVQIAINAYLKDDFEPKILRKKRYPKCPPEENKVDNDQ